MPALAVCSSGTGGAGVGAFGAPSALDADDGDAVHVVLKVEWRRVGDDDASGHVAGSVTGGGKVAPDPCSQDGKCVGGAEVEEGGVEAEKAKQPGGIRRADPCALAGERWALHCTTQSDAATLARRQSKRTWSTDCRVVTHTD